MASSLQQELSTLLNDAGQFAQQMGLAEIDTPLLFIVLQQRYAPEVEDFLTVTTFRDDGRSSFPGHGAFYGAVGQILNNMPRGGHSRQLPMSSSLGQAINLAMNIEGSMPQNAPLRFPHGALLASLFLVQGPMKMLGESVGITTRAMETAIEMRQGGGMGQSGPREPQSTRANNCPTLEQFCTNWIEQAREGKLHRAIGRDAEIKRVLQILSLSTKNNPILVGAPGTGKTAIVEGLACQLLNGEVPDDLKNLKIYQLDLGVLDSIGNAEEVMRKMVDELKQDTSVVLFIDEIHTLVSSHAGANNPIANLLKPEMARGSIKILGATTTDEYTQHIEKDKAFERRFQKVTVDELKPEDAAEVLKIVKKRFEQHHKVTIPDSVAELAVNLSHRFIPDRRLPDKAIDLLDEAAAYVHMETSRQTVEDKDVMDIVTRWTGIPMQSMDEEDTERLRHIEEHLHEQVIGQDQAISAVANAIRRSRMGFNDASRPIGSFLFLGTTGVGKTEVCKALAEFLFHSRDAIVRIDMSEYQQEHTVSRLFGAPPGYIGYEQGGQLTEAVRHKPYSIVLFDEFEKAHPKVFETLLQVLDDGRMTDGQGRVVDFKNTIIVMTSNVGQPAIMRYLTGQEPTPDRIAQATDAVMQQLKQRVAPEFINRIDKTVMFLPLTRQDIRKIGELQLKSAAKRLKKNGIDLTYDTSILDFVEANGYQPEYGGRPVKRVVNNHVIDALSMAIVNNEVSKQQPIEAFVFGGRVMFRNVTNG
ncbi:MAG: ATP-dependent Clp protease ATP-binding subunit [Bacteroidales bacterium]|nr:ATP-dependent Clp protease ATP-binding subunit [Bacteroidales bacterium]